MSIATKFEAAETDVVVAHVMSPLPNVLTPDSQCALHTVHSISREVASSLHHRVTYGQAVLVLVAVWARRRAIRRSPCAKHW